MNAARLRNSTETRIVTQCDAKRTKRHERRRDGDAGVAVGRERLSAGRQTDDQRQNCGAISDARLQRDRTRTMLLEKSEKV